MYNPTSPARRGAFTLIEMLVVIALILILMTIAAAMFPRFAENHRIIKGADQISTMLLTARQRALRDRVPVGVRIEFDGTGANAVANRLIYVKQVDDFAKKDSWFVGLAPPNNPRLFAFQGLTPATPGPFDFDPTYFQTQADLAPVQNGDYLEVNRGGLVMLIDGVIPRDGTNPLGNQLLLANPLLDTSPLRPAQLRSYRIIRQPRPVEGEPALELPQNIVIHRDWSEAVPFRRVMLGDPRTPANRVPKDYAEILFAPGGGVVGRGTGSGENIILWVRDGTKQGQMEGSPLLVSIHTRTGLIAVHPVNVAGANRAEWYQFTRDGRSSGL